MHDAARSYHAAATKSLRADATGLGMAMHDAARSYHAAATKSLKKYDRSITRLSALV